MAKKKINDYIFHTGIPYSENRYPNAYWLIQNNVEFIKDEVRAYINSEIAIAAQYNVTGATYTPTDHTMVLTIGAHALTVGSFIKLATDSLTFTPALTIDYTDIFLVKAITADSITIDVPTSDVTARTFSSANANAVINVFYNYTNDSNDKCERDMGYNLIGGDPRNPVQDQPGGLLYDLRYGGNEQARYLASTYWDGALPQIDGDRNPERAAKEFCAWLIKTYILDNVAYTTKQSPAETTQTINTEYVAETEADAVVDKVLTETIGEVIYFGTPNMPAFENARISRALFPSKVKQENLLLITDTTNNVVLFNFSDPTTGAETKYTEDSIEFTPTYEYFQKFLENTDNITQVLFDKTTENEEFLTNARNLLTQNKEFIKDEVRAWIADQVANAGSGSMWSGYTYTNSAIERDVGLNIDAIIKDMQYGGNDNIRSSAAGYWKGPTPSITGTREPEIATKNFMRDLVNNYILTKAVYPTKQGGTPETTQYFLGGTAELGGDTRVTELVAILTTVIKDGLSKLPPLDKPQIFHNTDKLQIFVDQGDLKVRPYDFGTDAIERHRVANSLSMLDADFEYGLQPTKWQAIGTMRGYPSTYEVPGTDTSVLSVVTDASTGSQGVGQSLITVTSVGPHGFEAGKPITIRGLDGSVAGNGRAEGTFIVNTVPTTTTFTYYAKAKVGSSAGTTLHTFYTILRGADFYTGATIQGDTPSFEVTTQGSNGSFSLALGALSGENRLTTQQSPPNLGAPLQTAGGEIPLGSQVTGTVGAGGITTTPVTTADTPQGSFTIDVQDASAVTVGTGLDRGDGFAAFVTQVSGNTLTLSEATTRVLVGNTVTYTGVTGSNDNSIGNGASFDVVRTNGVYNTTLNSGGQDYQVGDNILIDGGQVGGASGTNDIRILVDTVDTGGEILTFTETGVGFDGNGTFFDRTGTLQGGIGTTPVFDVTYTNNVYTVSVASPDTSGGYVVGDQIKIDGFELGGQSVTNDVIIKVEAVGTGGGITTVSATGTAVDADVSYSSPSYTTTTVSGVDADFNIQRIGTAYTVFITNAGTGYLAGESFTILGSALGGTDGVNNLTITIATVDTGGEILTVNTSGTAVNTKTYGYVTTGTNFIGSGAEFQVDLASGAYTVTVQSAGSSYGVDQQIVIQGTEMSGASPANDITITITSVNASDGGISGISFTGTGATGSGNYTAIIGNNDPNSGADAVFDVTRTGGSYSLVVATNDGAGYKVGDRIIIPGDQLGGATPTNDLTLRCTVESTEGDFVGIDVTGTAVSGDVLDLYSSVTMSEQTTGQINASTVITYSALASIRVTFVTPHGLVPGDAFAVTISSDDGANNHALAAGPFSATAVPSNVQLEYQCRSPGFLDTTSDQQITGNVYPRPDSFFIHRPYDGGVQLGTGGPQHGSQALRQSKK